MAVLCNWSASASVFVSFIFAGFIFVAFILHPLRHQLARLTIFLTKVNAPFIT
jgi:hypothetical protein